MLKGDCVTYFVLVLGGWGRGRSCRVSRLWLNACSTALEKIKKGKFANSIDQETNLFCSGCGNSLGEFPLIFDCCSSARPLGHQSSPAKY